MRRPALSFRGLLTHRIVLFGPSMRRPALSRNRGVWNLAHILKDLMRRPAVLFRGAKRREISSASTVVGTLEIPHFVRDDVWGGFPPQPCRRVGLKPRSSLPCSFAEHFRQNIAGMHSAQPGRAPKKCRYEFIPAIFWRFGAPRQCIPAIFWRGRRKAQCIPAIFWLFLPVFLHGVHTCIFLAQLEVGCPGWHGCWRCMRVAWSGARQWHGPREAAQVDACGTRQTDRGNKPTGGGKPTGKPNPPESQTHPENKNPPSSTAGFALHAFRGARLRRLSPDSGR